MSHSDLQSRPSAARTGPQIGATLAAGGVHLTGWVGVAAVLLLVLLGTGHVQWLWDAHRLFGDPSYYGRELAIHLGLSAVIWALLVVLWKTAWAAKTSPARLVKRGQGTVITETIIVLPVLLFIILGVSQLAVNNVANMLLNYGATQAARTVWVWAPETQPLVGSPRMGVTDSQVEDMARIQAAAAMTPVAPSSFAAGRAADSLAFERMRATLLASQMLRGPNDAGRDALMDADSMDAFDAADSLTFVRALDSANFAERTVRKFTSAYMAAEVEVLREDNQVGVDLTYHHQITFPLVGLVFGSSGSVEGAAGYYMPMHREVFFRAQVEPNGELPRR